MDRLREPGPHRALGPDGRIRQPKPRAPATTHDRTSMSPTIVSRRENRRRTFEPSRDAFAPVIVSPTARVCSVARRDPSRTATLAAGARLWIKILMCRPYAKHWFPVASARRSIRGNWWVAARGFGSLGVVNGVAEDRSLRFQQSAPAHLSVGAMVAGEGLEPPTPGL